MTIERKYEIEKFAAKEIIKVLIDAGIKQYGDEEVEYLWKVLVRRIKDDLREWGVEDEP